MQKRLRDMLHRLEPAIDRNFIEQTPAIMLVSRVLEMRFVAVMAAPAAAPYRSTAAEMSKRRVDDITSPSIRGFIEELDVNPAWRNGEISMWQAVLRRVDGSWCQFTGTPIGGTGFFMCIGSMIPPPNEFSDKDYQLTLNSYDEMGE